VGNVEFARQIVERAVVDDDLRKFMNERQHVYQLNWINAGSRICGKIAYVIRARAASMKADGLDSAQDFRRVFRLDKAHLKISTRSNLHVTRREFLGDAGEFAQLIRLDHTAGDSKPRHKRLFVRRQKKQA